MRVSCLMVTRPSRMSLAQDAIRDFLSQDYPDRELIVVSDASDPSTIAGRGEAYEFEQMCDVSHIPNASPVVPVISMPGKSLGELRNLSVEAATGDILIQWDDDDRYATNRVSRQVEALLSNPKASCSCLTSQLYHFVHEHQVYWVDWNNRRPKFNSILIPGTIAVHRVAAMSAQYPAKSRGEDGDYLNAILAGGEAVALPADEACLYVRRYHGQNTWNNTHFLSNAKWMGRTKEQLRQPEARAVLSQVDFESAVAVVGRDGHAYDLGRLEYDKVLIPTF